MKNRLDLRGYAAEYLTSIGNVGNIPVRFENEDFSDIIERNLQIRVTKGEKNSEKVLETRR